jgi:hypothetical protein
VSDDAFHRGLESPGSSQPTSYERAMSPTCHPRPCPEDPASDMLDGRDVLWSGPIRTGSIGISRCPVLRQSRSLSPAEPWVLGTSPRMTVEGEERGVGCFAALSLSPMQCSSPPSVPWAQSHRGVDCYPINPPLPNARHRPNHRCHPARACTRTCCECPEDPARNISDGGDVHRPDQSALGRPLLDAAWCGAGPTPCPQPNPGSSGPTACAEGRQGRG